MELLKYDGDLNDEEILVLSQEDPTYFTFLVSKYQDAFLRAARGITRNLEEAQDIVQETFIKIYRYSENFQKRPGIAFKSWAYRILINTAITHYQKLKRERGNTEYIDLVLYDDSLPLSKREDFDLKRDILTGVSAVIGAMPEHLARVLKMYYFEDRSYEEIARSEKISMPALKMRMFRAKRAFKKISNSNL
ncbi:MAG: RNA polymerase sigma factor [Patescibacteria group bacterium]|nr:RNA polymerase sigma factor [Patescibacteria group bacterium]